MFTKNASAHRKQLMEGVDLISLTWGRLMNLTQFNVQKDCKIPPHSHPHEQIGYLVSGKLRLTIADETFEAEPGDSWCIPADVDHHGQAVEACVAVEVFSPLREDYLP